MLLNSLQFVLHIDRYLPALADRYGFWIYPILFFIIFAETGFVVTPFLPGDSLLFVAGAVAAAGGLDPWLLSISLFCAAILGNTCNYWVGRFIGPRVFHWEHSRWFNRHALDEAHAFYERYGGVTITLARFMPIVRTFAPFVAGVAAMEPMRFQGWSVLGALLWIFLFIWCGYLFGDMPMVQHNMSMIVAAVAVISLLPMAVGIVRARRARLKVDDR